MTTQYFDDKAATEKVVLTFDCSDELPSGVTVVSAAVDVSVLRGIDAAPTGILNGAGSANAAPITRDDGNIIAIGQAWLQGVQAGVVGAQYLIRALITTTDPKIVLNRSGILPVTVA